MYRVPCGANNELKAIIGCNSAVVCFMQVLEVTSTSDKPLTYWASVRSRKYGSSQQQIL